MSMSMFRKYFATLATHLAGPDSGPEGSSLGREGRGQTCSHSQRAPRSDRTWHRQQHYLTQTTTIPDTNNNITSHRQQLYLNQTTTFPHAGNNITSHKANKNVTWQQTTTYLTLTHTTLLSPHNQEEACKLYPSSFTLHFRLSPLGMNLRGVGDKHLVVLREETHCESAHLLWWEASLYWN